MFSRFASSLVAALLGALSFAQDQKPLGLDLPQGDQTGGYAATSEHQKLFDEKTLETVRGKVIGIVTSPPALNMDEATSLLVKGSGGVTLVELGPRWFVERQEPTIHLKDTVAVTGSRVNLAGSTYLIAVKVTKGDQTMALREKTGAPTWDAARSVNELPSASFHKLEGTIINVQDFPAGTDPTSSDRSVSVQTPDGVLTLVLGPTWFVARQNFQLTVGDALTIYTGAPIQVAPGVYVTADRIRRGDDWLIMRHDNGQPVWNTWVGPPPG
ncbi:MAG: hypothetical protein HYR64_03305 [Fimbriimonas ginsengisoli]|uniref:Magnetosome protein MamS/MamX domain-containing protein n=1 Tax=Fimbriimonas ginsengisoli TaxID=1005039 RepID=A0A931LWF4_FIMGI|nr:hypothetical protein [Fimbriimonas ginsengisoli]